VALRFACVVEGHGEVEAVPVLVRRIAQELHPMEPVPVVAVDRAETEDVFFLGKILPELS
jgi:hypothetical protein